MHERLARQIATSTSPAGEVVVAALLGEVSATYETIDRDRLAAETQAVRFKTALDNMSQGLCFFDGRGRLIVCNRRYAEMYGLDMADLPPGTTLEAIVEMRFKAGSCPAMTQEEYIAWRDQVAVSDQPSDTTVQLQDGRVFVIHHRPMADGGWVATHEDITERRRAEARIAHMARHDALTGLANRVLLRERLEQSLATLRERQGGLAAVLCLDLDRFKEVNDTLGHAVGDRLLQEAAARMQALLRPTDTFARLGGDEFAIVMNGLSDPSQPAGVARRIIDAIRRRFELDSHTVEIGISIGIALSWAGDAWTDPGRPLCEADLALYCAKRDGRSGYRVFEQAMDSRQQARRTLERDLRRALAEDQFELHYQPQVDLRSGRTIGVEALIRWRHPDRGIVPPADFIPLAEETGLIVPIGEWVLRTACAQAAGWPDLHLAVNLSPVQIRQPNLVELVTAVLADTGLPPSRLEVEITEGILLHGTASTVGKLRRLKALGIKIAMDDFGTSYSSLSYLRKFPFDKLKIDRSFIADLDGSSEAEAIVEAMIGLGRALGMHINAEGIETTEQAACLRAAGCTEGQGYLYARPLPAADFERLAAAATAPGGAAMAPTAPRPTRVAATSVGGRPAVGRPSNLVGLDA